nr:HAMP domain-containing sensor histidine kinase [uncultured Sphingorhabdus sp.]
MQDGVTSVDDTAHVLIFNPWVTLLGQVAYVIVTGLIYILYEPLVAADVMRIWVVVALCVFALVVCLNLGYLIRRPDAQELLRIWRAIDKKVPMLFDLIAALSIWLLFPKGGSDLQLISVAFCVGYVPLQMISDPENTFGNRFSIVVVLGSYVAWLMLNGSPTQQILAMLMIIYGAVLFFAADAFRNVVVAAVARREESERSAAALRQAVSEVAAERDAKTRFIASASHDLGQPLQAANLFAGHLVGADNEAERAAATNGILRAVADAQRLVGDMLSHLRLEADAVSPRVTEFPVGSALQALALQYGPSAKIQNIEIRVLATAHYVAADAALLDRAIGNLLGNAIAHSGGNRILVGARGARSGVVTIWVIDNGAGINLQDQPHIFDDYFQSSSTRDRVRGGFGLGLSSVKRIAKLLRGDAGLDDRWHGGAAFYVTVPQAGRGN